MIDFVAAIESESARFSHLLRTTDTTKPVPSCPGWSLADLAWHLAEVQYFWACIADGPLASPESVAELTRPDDGSLPSLFAEQSTRLITAIRSHEATEPCWSWHDAGHSIGWVARRQAHEALIHRVDAELAAGGPFTVDESLATDGVDEILRVFLDASTLPEWATFDPDGATASLQIDTGPSWDMRLGRFRGTSPNTGTTYDDPALALGAQPAEPTLVVTGAAADLDLWLWGRGSIRTLQVEGEGAAADSIRAAAAAGTQ